MLTLGAAEELAIYFCWRYLDGQAVSSSDLGWWSCLSKQILKTFKCSQVLDGCRKWTHNKGWKGRQHKMAYLTVMKLSSLESATNRRKPICPSGHLKFTFPNGKSFRIMIRQRVWNGYKLLNKSSNYTIPKFDKNLKIKNKEIQLLN